MEPSAHGSKEVICLLRGKNIGDDGMVPDWRDIPKRIVLVKATAYQELKKIPHGRQDNVHGTWLHFEVCPHLKKKSRIKNPGILLVLHQVVIEALQACFIVFQDVTLRFTVDQELIHKWGQKTFKALH